jgi:hypothetical protein
MQTNFYQPPTLSFWPKSSTPKKAKRIPRAKNTETPLNAGGAYCSIDENEEMYPTVAHFCKRVGAAAFDLIGGLNDKELY